MPRRVTSGNDCHARRRCRSAYSIAAAIIALPGLLLLSATERNRAQAEEVRPEQGAAIVKNSPADSRIWYILRQPNSMGLFHGLPQRMEAFATVEEQAGEAWEGIADGGNLRLRIDSEAEGEIFVGFFSDPRWWLAKPVQVRSFPGPGEYTVKGLPPGEYYLGAIIGTITDLEALGLERNWPAPIPVQAGSTSHAQLRVLMSDHFKWHHLPVRDPRDFIGAPRNLDPSRLVTVRTADAEGNAVPYCRVTYVLRDEQKTHEFLEAGTDAQGFSHRDDIKGTFSLSAVRKSFDPTTLATRFQSVKLPELYDPADRPVIVIEWEPFPTGTGTVAGRVVDQEGHPLTEFHVHLRMDVGERLGWDFSKAAGLRIPVTNPDGRFQVHGLAPGPYTITASAFDHANYAYQSLEDRARFVIPHERNAEVHVNVVLQSRQPR